MDLDESPSLHLDWRVFERNIADISSHLQSNRIRWRPHIKSHSSGLIARHLVDSGAVGVTVATLGQARIMVESGIESVLLTTPLARLTDWHRLDDLQSKAEVLVTIDAYDQLSLMRDARPRRPIPVVIELDLGLNRTGTRSITEALELARLVSRERTAHLAGFMGYEGHVFRLWPLETKRLAHQTAMARLASLVSEARREGLDFELVTGSGSGSLFLDSSESPINESQAGGGAFMDMTYLEDFHVPRLQPALFINSTVVATHPPATAIIDAGFKAFGASRRLPAPQGSSWQIGPVSAHMSVLTGDVASLKVGSRVSLIPGYSDAAMQGFTELIVDHTKDRIPLRAAS